MSMKLHTELRCGYTGLTIGQLEVITTAGALPYLSHWDKMMVRHPVFSLSPQRLFIFVRDEWKRLAQRAADSEITTAESNILCAAYLATLHTLGGIKQDMPALPPLDVVQSTISRVVSLAYWKWHLESARFRFPMFHISKQNANADFKDIGNYLDVCFKIKEDYATRITELEERERERVARDAIDALSREWVQPVSKKILWTWVKAQLPAKYAAEAQGWLGTLFLGGSAAIIDFDEEDIELFEEIIDSECPSEAGIKFAVRQRIAKVWEVWKQHHEAFTIDIADYAKNAGLLVNNMPVTMPDPGPAPLPSAYDKRFQYIQADSRWKIAKAAFDAQCAKSDDPVINHMLAAI